MSDSPTLNRLCEGLQTYRTLIKSVFCLAEDIFLLSPITWSATDWKRVPPLLCHCSYNGFLQQHSRKLEMSSVVSVQCAMKWSWRDVKLWVCSCLLCQGHTVFLVLSHHTEDALKTGSLRFLYCDYLNSVPLVLTLILNRKHHGAYSSSVSIPLLFVPPEGTRTTRTYSSSREEWDCSSLPFFSTGLKWD